MIPIKNFYCNSTPKEEELKEALQIATDENCVVCLKWFVKYNSWFDRYIHKDTDIEEMNNRLRHIVYGL